MEASSKSTRGFYCKQKGRKCTYNQLSNAKNRNGKQLCDWATIPERCNCERGRTNCGCKKSYKKPDKKRFPHYGENVCFGCGNCQGDSRGPYDSKGRRAVG